MNEFRSGLEYGKGYDQGVNDMKAEIKRLRAALEATQWGFNHVRCPVCAGWDGNTERDYVHNVDCIVAKALANEGGE